MSDQKDAPQGQNAVGILDQMDAALKKYYQVMGAGDRYTNDKGEGLFKSWCGTNGLDDEQLVDELGCLDGDEWKDCLLLDYDDNFPLSDGQQNLKDEEKQKAIANVLRQCRSKEKYIRVCTQQDFDALSAEQVQDISNIYKDLCPAIYNKGMKTDGSLLQMLAVQYLLDMDANYMQCLVDSYNVYRIKSDTPIGLFEWINLKNNRHFQMREVQSIKNKHQDEKGNSTVVKYAEFIKHCMTTYLNRICPVLSFHTSRIRINDSIQRIMEYLAEAARFVSSSVTNTDRVQGLICPFQVDFCIVVGKPEQKEEAEDSDDDDDDDDNAPKTEEIDYTLDFVGDIKSKLDNNGLKYVQSDEQDPESRMFVDLLNKLAGGDATNVEKKQHFLHKKRLLAFIDRRPTKDDNKTDPMFMFEPPKAGPDGQWTAVVPNKCARRVPEWYVSASRSCLLPPGPKHKFNADEAVGNTQNTNNAEVNKPGMNVGASFHCAGRLLTFSFHVPTANEVKLYLYWNGQMTRLLPEDIIFVLSQIFVDNAENKNYADLDNADNQNKEAKEERDALLKDLKQIIVDETFNAWINKSGVAITK